MNKSKLNDYLMFSVEIGNVEWIKHCIENGADIHANDNYNEALVLASMCGHYEVVKLLLEHGANVHVGVNNALRWADYYGHCNVSELLLEKE